MPTKTELALAAIIALRQSKPDPSFEDVAKLVKDKHGETLSKSTYQLAKTRLPEVLSSPVAVMAEPEVAPPPRPESPPGLHGIDRLIGAMHLARQLVNALDGDREAACKLLKEI